MRVAIIASCSSKSATGISIPQLQSARVLIVTPVAPTIATKYAFGDDDALGPRCLRFHLGQAERLQVGLGQHDRVVLFLGRSLFNPFCVIAVTEKNTMAQNTITREEGVLNEFMSIPNS